MSNKRDEADDLILDKVIAETMQQAGATGGPPADHTAVNQGQAGSPDNSPAARANAQAAAASSGMTNHGPAETPKGGEAPDPKGAVGASEPVPTKLVTNAERFAEVLELELNRLWTRTKNVLHIPESHYKYKDAKNEFLQTLKAIEAAYRLAEMSGTSFPSDTSETITELRQEITNLGPRIEECLKPLSKLKTCVIWLDGAIVGSIAPLACLVAGLIVAYVLMSNTQQLAPTTAAAKQAAANVKGPLPDAPVEKRDKPPPPEKLPESGAPLGKGDRQMSPGPDPKAVEAAGQLAGQVKELKDFLTAAKLNELPKRIAEAQPPAKRAANDRLPDNPRDLRDVMIVALNSPNLSAKEYVRVYEHVLSQFARGKDARPRVGLVVAQTGEANLWVKLTDEKVNLSALGAPAPNATESPDRFGETLKGFFDPLRPARRVVLVASIDCPPLLPDTGGWRELEVHVVLVARRDLTPEDRDRLLQWHHVDAQGGSVRLVPGPGSTVPLDRQLQDRVLDLCKMKVD